MPTAHFPLVLTVLEDRTTPSSAGSGDAWPDPGSLTISFAPDAAKLGSDHSTLFDTFNKVAKTDAWQFEILKAFQTWAAVSNLNVGLVKDGDRWVLLTDIIGDEDHFGDMDFKIAGTQNGITGIQLDLKIDGISEEIVRATLAQSREARMEILRSMLSTIPRPRPNTSPTAPRLARTKIDPEKIGLLIGPGGS